MENPAKPLYKPTASTLHRPSQLLALGPSQDVQPALFESPHRPLRFRIKRHRATSLHTDFRFEISETLFSLASWKHPSLDPSRSIALREMPDHDPAYMDSERRIPDGAYGAGPMIVWDYGTYAPAASFEGSPSDAVLEALLGGRLDFRFDGQRMQGAFRLEIMDRGWRLAKMEDEFATTEPFEWDDLSTVSGRSLEDVEREYQASVRRLRGRSSS